MPQDLDSTTALSHRRRLATGKIGRFQGLARQSQRLACVLLLALGPVSLGGCLVADAPDYGGPQQTPPRIESLTIQPSPFALITVPEGTVETRFTFKVYSEDANERLWTAFYQDYGLVEGTDTLDDRPVPPSTLDEPRTVSIPVPLWKMPDGCHQVTLLVMHESTWDGAEDRPRPERAVDDVASVTWWANVRPNPDAPVTLASCPSPAQPSAAQ
jgi:hypothetical protein